MHIKKYLALQYVPDNSIVIKKAAYHCYDIPLALSMTMA